MSVGSSRTARSPAAFAFVSTRGGGASMTRSDGSSACAKSIGVQATPTEPYSCSNPDLARIDWWARRCHHRRGDRSPGSGHCGHRLGVYDRRNPCRRPSHPAAGRCGCARAAHPTRAFAGSIHSALWLLGRRHPTLRKPPSCADRAGSHATVGYCPRAGRGDTRFGAWLNSKSAKDVAEDCFGPRCRPTSCGEGLSGRT